MPRPIRTRLFVAAALAQLPAWALGEEGTLGWRYIDWYGAGATVLYADDPVTACAKTTLPGAFWGLVGMEPVITSAGWDGGTYRCFLQGHYAPPIGDNQISLACDFMAGYIVQFPGVCKKRQEPPAPPECSASSAGFTVGNPVMLASGAKIQDEVELQGNQWNTLQVTRLYRTARTASVSSAAGFIWSFPFERQLLAEPASNGKPPPYVTLFNGDGTSVRFRNSGNQYMPADGSTAVLTPLSADFHDWILKEAIGKLDRFSKVGARLLLTEAGTAAGQSTQYSYDSNGKLAAIKDTAGRTLKVSWHDDYTIASIASAELEVHYAYEHLGAANDVPTPGAARLIRVSTTTPDGAVLGTRQYHYGDYWKNWFSLTGITDENNVRYASYDYDSAARAIRSEHAGGADRYDISYPSDSTRIVTDPLGASRTVTLIKIGAQSRIAKFSQPGGAGCGPAASDYIYNSNGTLLSRTDFNGTKTCYTYDPVRRLETSRLEGVRASACPAASALPSAGQRKTSTRWHPDWAIPVAVAAPLKLTQYVYNGQPDLDGKVLECAAGATLPNGLPIAVPCKKVETPTNDAKGGAAFNATPAGPSRLVAYTYNRQGQVLTETTMGRAGSAGDTITYTYYTDTDASHHPGDLATVTLPNGETTEYLEYTPSGRPTKIRETNGQITIQSFSPQGRLLLRTIYAGTPDEQQTRYSYDPAGQLVHVDFPDTTSITYSYDGAHRLTGIADSAGNTIRYVLDPAGNRIKEEVHDAKGILRHQVTRVFDVLGRLQQTSEGAQQ